LHRFRRHVLGLILIAALLASCSSSTPKAEPATSSSSIPTPSIPTAPTVDPNQEPNPIPYNVGERIGLPNGWLVQVTRVHRPYVAAGLPSVPAGQQFVGVDLTMDNEGTAAVTVNARRVFKVNDATGTSHPVVSGAEGAKDIDGTYGPGVSKSGRLVFAVPVGSDLVMLLDGPVIHTQRSVFQVDPPTTPARD
jgi:hypothetical protein